MMKMRDEAPDEWTKMRRAKLRVRLLVGGCIVVVAGALFVYVAFAMTRHHFGEACEKRRDCSDANGLCLITAKGQVCTTWCEKTADCANGFSCVLSNTVGVRCAGPRNDQGLYRELEGLRPGPVPVARSVSCRR